jgi:hypothetical protein
METRLGWRLTITKETKITTLKNFLVQSTGAHMLQAACCSMTEAGIQVCAPLHDAVLIEAPERSIDSAVEEAKRLMTRTSEELLDGLSVRVDAKVVKYPGRYMDPRGERMWDVVGKVLRGLTLESV